MTQLRTLIIALTVTDAVSAFSLLSTKGTSYKTTPVKMSSAPDAGDEEPKLVLGDIASEMQNVRKDSGADFDFGGIDFLANAKARAKAKVESNNNVAGDEAWQQLAEEKKEQYGEIDDWENSMKEAGNMDSQILMFSEAPSDGEEGEGGDDDEPKLLLF